MSDSWTDEGFGDDNDWGETEEAPEPDLEDALLDPETLESDPASWDDDPDL